jgi:hypothetical protein
MRVPRGALALRTVNIVSAITVGAYRTEWAVRTVCSESVSPREADRML